VRVAALFLALFLPLCGLLLLGSRGGIFPQVLPEQPAEEGGPSVLASNELADDHGLSPLPGRLLWLKGLSVRAVKEGYIYCEAGFSELVREEGLPRARGIWCRSYEKSAQGTGVLRAEIRSPYLDGDPAQFVHARRGDPLLASLRGGVEARDAQGRLLLRVPDQLFLDFAAQRLWTGERVALAQPEEGVEIAATGMSADALLKQARLFRDITVTLRLPGEEGHATLRCDGPLGVRSLEEALLLEAEGAVVLDHPQGRVECDRLEVYVVKARKGEGKGGFAPALAVGFGNVFLRSPDGGIVARAHRLVWDGRLATLEGPVTARREGPFPAFGPGERTVEITAATAEFDLDAGNAILRGGVTAEDAAGAGSFRADEARLGPELLEAEGSVRARLAVGSLEARSVRIEKLGEGRSLARLTGVKRLEFRSKGGPGGGDEERTVRIACGGLLEAEGDDAGRTLTAGGGVEAILLDAEGRESSRLSARTLRASLRGDELVEITATEEVVMSDAVRRSVVSGDRLNYVRATGAARVEGAPARLTLPGDEGGRRTVRAAALVYHEPTREFHAEGEVFLETALRAADQARIWRIRCTRAEGATDPTGAVVRLAAEGTVVAEGPSGERIEGARLVYDAREETATLTGEPARLVLGAQGWIEAPEFLVTIDVGKGDLKAARTRGKGELAYSPEPGAHGAIGSIHVWRVTLEGPAEFRDLSVRVPSGATLRALDAAGKILVQGKAGDVVLRLERREGKLAPIRLEGSRGVVVKSTTGKRGPVEIEAQRLSYEPDSARVVLQGSARAAAQGIAPQARFARIELVLTKDGVSDLECFNLEIAKKADDVQPEPR